MKRIVIIILFLIASSLYGGWIKSGNTELLVTSYSTFKDFVISGESKFIYSLDDKGTIKKFDFVTGDSISALNIIPDTNLPRTSNWAFLSDDAKTFCYAYNPYLANFKGFNDARICDIETGSILYSLNIPFTSNLSTRYSVGFDNITYDSEKKLFISAFSSDLSSDYPYWDGFSGEISIQSFRDSVFILLSSVRGGSNLFFTDHTSETLYFNNSMWDWYQIHPGSKTTSWKKKISSLIDLSTNETKSLFYYEYYSDTETGNWSKGTDFNITSGFFSNDDSKLFLNDGNQVCIIDAKAGKLLENHLLNEIPKNIKLKIKDTPDNDFILVIADNLIHIYRSDNLSFCKTIDVSTPVSEVKFSPDNKFLAFTNSVGSLYRISSDELFSLKANFGFEDSIAIQGEDFHFFNCTVGKPDSNLWDFGEMVTSAEWDPVYQFSDTGYHDIKLMVYKGNVTDSVIKNKVIYVIPGMYADFNYIATPGVSTLVDFNNKSTGAIDSVLWDFGDGYYSKDFHPSHEFMFNGTYLVELTIFSKNKTKRKTDSISINNPEHNLKEKRIAYELYDNRLTGCEALIAYELENKDIVYHIIGDSSNYIGRNSAGNIIWERSFGGKRSFMIEAGDRQYTYFVDSTMYRMNYQGNELYKTFLINANNITAVRSYNDTVLLSVFKSHNFYLYEVSPDNSTKSNANYGIWEYNSGGIYNCHDVLNNYIVAKDGTDMDYAVSYNFYYTQNGDNKTSRRFVINQTSSSNLPIFEFTDMFRLDDSTLVFSESGSIKFIKFYTKSSIPPDSNNQNFTILKEISLSGFKIKSILKITASKFLVIGSFETYPAVLTLNDKGEIIDSIIVRERRGCFNSASVTEDSGLLLSGYRMIDYGIKVPYFIKLTDSINTITTDTLTGISDVNSYPNPSNQTITITFSLQKTSELSIKLYDCFGAILQNSITKEYPKGKSEETFELSAYSTGSYIYIIELDGEAFPGKFIYMKP